MALIEPVALWLLLLVAILLLLARRQTARVRRPVANLYMWSRPSSGSATEVRFKRWRKHWLVILQAAILTLMVAALARPTFSSSSRPVALIVDSTVSMAARDAGGARMDQARAAAAAAVGALPRGARVRLFTAGHGTADLGEFARSDPRLAAALRGITATASGGGVARTVRAVRTTVGTAASITVISDHRDAQVSDADVGWIIVGHPVANQAITMLEARRLPTAPDAGQILTTIWNHAPAATARDIEITQDGAIVSRRRIELGSQRGVTIINDVGSIGGVIRARLDGTDALPHDDERATIVPSIERARVVLTAGAGSFFLERALATNPNLSPALAAPSETPEDVDVVVCNRCTELPPYGRAVLMIRAVEAAEVAPVSVSLADHPIATTLDLGAVMAAGADLGPLPVSADVVLRVGPHPAVIAYHHGDRRVVEIRLDIATTGFPLHPVFPVLLDNVLGWLGARGENRTSLLAGEPLRWRLKAPSAGKGVAITGPDGREIKATVNGTIVTATDTDVPGVYTIHAGGETRPVVVNAVTEGESDLSGSGTSAPGQAGRVPESKTTSWEVAPLLLVLALAFLVLEWRARVGSARVA